MKIRRRSSRYWWIVALVMSVALPAQAAPSTDGAGPLGRSAPPMGWNSWNSFGCDIDEGKIKSMADALVSSGMRDAGYRYLVIDDCWFDPSRGANGELRGDPRRFPHGMKAIGDYLHELGLKFGIYEVPTELTCAQRNNAYPGSTGSQGHEQQDANTFASWGVDYLKYDWCSPKGTLEDQVTAFKKMRNALRGTGRSIYYSINANSYHFPKYGQTRSWSGIANASRTTEDIKPVWRTEKPNEYPMGVTDIIDVNGPLSERAKPGYVNDPDMLEVGVYDVEGHAGLSDVEAKSHFTMWSMMAAPLMAGNDVRESTPAIRSILTNRDVIALDQDRRVHQAELVGSVDSAQIYRKRLSDGSVAIALLNRTSTQASMSVSADQIGLDGGAYRARELWTGTQIRGSGGLAPVTVPAHGVVLYRVYR